MSYTVELSSPIVSSLSAAPERKSVVEDTEQPSSVELFSYGLCCAAQGLMAAFYLVVLTLVPIAITHGLLTNFFADLTF